MKKEKEIKKDEKIDEQIKTIKEDILNRKQQKIPSFIEEDILLQDQQHKERFQNMIKLELTENECIQCGVCVKVCPRANIKLEDKPIKETHANNAWDVYITA
jgi:ferredoxin